MIPVLFDDECMLFNLSPDFKLISNNNAMIVLDLNNRCFHNVRVADFCSHCVSLLSDDEKSLLQRNLDDEFTIDKQQLGYTVSFSVWGDDQIFVNVSIDKSLYFKHDGRLVFFFGRWYYLYYDSGDEVDEFGDNAFKQTKGYSNIEFVFGCSVMNVPFDMNIDEFLDNYTNPCMISVDNLIKNYNGLADLKEFFSDDKKIENLIEKLGYGC